MSILTNIAFWELLAMIWIAVSVQFYSKKAATMTAVSELRDRSDLAWASIKRISNDYSNLSEDERDLVARYLNEYEHFCRLYNHGVLSRRIARIARKDTILEAYRAYFEPFVVVWRSQQKKPNAWAQFEKCAKKLTKC